MQTGAATSLASRPPAGMPRAGFAELVAANADGLYGYCLRLSGRQHDAEDLLQEALLRAIKAYASLRDLDRGRAWLFTIVTNAWRDRERARNRRPATVPLDGSSADDDFSLFATIAIEDPFPYSDELHLDFLRLFRDEDVQAVFGTISEVHRLPLILTIIHGFSCKEAAAILRVPLGTLLSRLHRGRKQLERGLWDYAVRNGLVKVGDDDD
ncbi:MAG: RNA polymerase sigma factor [Chloroflexota bacterium]|jgi:RNA polymerase sigma-70 factor (ECF subfamily)|nr:RNA polymerase sigma factor [Chloroflexota bacterium]